MKISWFNKIISPELGGHISGYKMDDTSISKLNDLYMTGLLVDDGERKVLLISFDLLCLDEIYIQKIDLDLQVKVDKNWRQKDTVLNRLI